VPLGDSDKVREDQERIELSRLIKLDVRKYFWYKGPSSDHGAAREKSFSRARASSQVTPYFKTCEIGCLTRNTSCFRGFSARCV
jgi:hypothetical protein